MSVGDYSGIEDRLDKLAVAFGGVGGAATWGGITGTLSNQTDLQAALDAKQNAGVVSDVAYDAATWDGVTAIAPSKNAVRDKIEALSATVSGLGTIASTTNLLKGNGTGSVVDSTILPSNVPLLNAANTFIAGPQSVVQSGTGAVSHVVAYSTGTGTTTRNSLAVREHTNQSAYQTELGITDTAFGSNPLGSSIVSGAVSYVNTGSGTHFLIATNGVTRMIFGSGGVGIGGTGVTLQGQDTLAMLGDRIVCENGGTFYVFSNTAATQLGNGNAGYLTSNSDGSVSITANSTNKSITLTPSGTGVISCAGRVRLKSYTVATLPSGTAGDTAYVTDGDASLAWGATVVNTGAGATKYACWFNGTNWTVMGK